MIALLRGVVLGRDDESVVVDVGGVGYRVCVPSDLLHESGLVSAEIVLHTELVVREDSLTLYGFREPAERDLFVVLQSVSKVGPRVALGILGALGYRALVRAIADGDTRALTAAPGVGERLAQRLVLELRERLAEVALEQSVESRVTQAASGSAEDLIAMLVNLGYSRSDSRRAAEEALRGAGPDTDLAAAVREALKVLTAERGRT